MRLLLRQLGPRTTTRHRRLQFSPLCVAAQGGTNRKSHSIESLPSLLSSAFLFSLIKLNYSPCLHIYREPLRPSRLTLLSESSHVVFFQALSPLPYVMKTKVFELTVTGVMLLRMVLDSMQ